MNDILKTTDIIQLHKQLDDFALHHQQKGIEKAFNEVVRLRDEFDSLSQDGSNNGQIHADAYRQALTKVIETIRPF
jgi:hypothetical protein